MARIRQGKATKSPAGSSTTANADGKPPSQHPAGPVKHGTAVETLRVLLFGVYFFGSCIFIHGTQLIGLPLYIFNRDLYYTWMSLTKQHFGLLITTMTQWWSPTVVRISGDRSMAGQLRKTRDGLLEVDFPERLVLISNHQIYTDWLYYWWIAYTGRHHGHVYIILKDSLKWIPLIGTGMQLFSFIFMARRWVADQARMAYRLRKLRREHLDDSGRKYLNPMWLLLFPEGTNLSQNARAASLRWANKSCIPDLKHQVLPRSTGLQFCLKELEGTIEWLYDCTIAYEHIPDGQYGQDIYTLRSVYFQGRPPKSVNMYWRRYKVSDMPVQDKEAMEGWILQRWREKDEILAIFQATGRFPSEATAVTYEEKKEEEEEEMDNAGGAFFIETEVRPKSPFEFLQIFVPVTAAGLVASNLLKLVNFVETGRFGDDG